MDINENLTVEQQSQRDSFYRLINRIEIFQKSISSDESDLLKATYSPDEDYKITFYTNHDSRLYEATYTGGELVRLIPENDDLFTSIKGKARDELATPDETTILKVSNPTIELDESIVQQINAPFPSATTNELNDILLNENPVDLQQELTEYGKRLELYLESEKELLQTLETFSERTKDLEEHPQLREETKEDVLLKVDEYNHLLELSIDRVNELEQRQSFIKVLSNVNYQSIRQDMLLESYYLDDANYTDVTLPVKAIGNLDPSIPMQRGFEQRFEEEQKRGASFALSLALNHQINDPKEQLKLHLNNYRNIQDMINQPYQPFGNEQLFNLREFATESINRAIEVVNKEFQKNHQLDIKFNRSIGFVPDIVDKSNEEAYKLLRPVAMLQEKEINLFNITEQSSGYESQTYSHWHKESLKAIDNYLMTNTDYSSLKDTYKPLEEIDQSISVLILKGNDKTELQNVELNKHLEVINNAVRALDEKLETLEPNENRKEIVQMRDYMNQYYENGLWNQLSINTHIEQGSKDSHEHDFNMSLAQEQIKSHVLEWCNVDHVDQLDKEDHEILQEFLHLTTNYKSQDQFEENLYTVYGNSDVEWLNLKNLAIIADSGKEQTLTQQNELTDEKSPDLKLLLDRIAELEKSVNKVEDRYVNVFTSLSGLKNTLKTEVGKIQDQLQKIGEQIESVKDKFKQFTYKKMESAYKVAFEQVDKLDNKVKKLKNSIENDFEAVKQKQEKYQQELKQQQEKEIMEEIER